MNQNITMPAIVKETSTGLMTYNIADAMLQNREINCAGEITAEQADALILQLRYLQQEDPDAAVTMYINSPGGEVSAGLALYDVMQAVSCPVRTVCMGLAASMGAVLFLSGSRREILPHARVMIHDPLVAGNIGGSALRVESVSRDLMKVREVMGTIIAGHTGKSLDEILTRTATDSYFDAEEAVAFGMADRIIERI